MFDTYVTVVGTVLNQPEHRRVEKTNAVVASFRVVANARRFDSKTDRWVDSNTFRIKVNCWRRLGENSLASVEVGDPIIVYGRISTRNWTNDQGSKRVAYEVDAQSVGHDLARGQSKFVRTSAMLATSVIEDEDSDSRVNGERTHLVGHLPEAPTEEPADVDLDLDDFPFDESDDGGADVEDDALSILRQAGLQPMPPDGDGDGDGDEHPEGDKDEEALAGAAAGSGGSGGRRSRRGRHPVPA